MSTDATTKAMRNEGYLGANIASATTTDLSTTTADLVHVTGTTTITSLGTCSAGREVTVIFDGILTLTHDATALYLPAAASITTAAKDCATFRSLGSGNWICTNYSPGAGGTGATLAGAETLSNKTLTAPTVNSPIIVTPTIKDLTEVVTSTNVITAAETGSVFFLNSATEFVSTLPAVAAGLHFTFIVKAAPSGASYTVICASSGTLIKGHVLTSQDAGGSADSETSGALTLTFVDGKAVAGDMAEFWCDGTNWFVTAKCKVFDAITIS